MYVNLRPHLDIKDGCGLHDDTYLFEDFQFETLSRASFKTRCYKHTDLTDKLLDTEWSYNRYLTTDCRPALNHTQLIFDYNEDHDLQPEHHAVFSEI